MKILLKITLCLALMSFFLSCAKSKSTGTGDQEVKNELPAKEAEFPYLTQEDINVLFEQTDKVDMLFYKAPISVSQDDVASAKNTARYVTASPAVIEGRCEPLGRLSWMSDGKIVREADFYVGQGCNYLAFIENNVPVYKNAMAEEGINFYNTLLNQIKSSPKQ